MQFVAIDFETANAKRHSPCAVGIVVANEEEIVDEYYSLINPLMEFSSFNVAIHGITADDITGAPTFAELWPTLEKYLANNLAVAHNASFDMSVIRQTLDYFDLPYPEMDYLCTANISRRIWPSLMNHKLNTVANYHGISFDHHHALEDARVAAKVFQHALNACGDTVDGILDYCQMRRGRIFERGYTTPNAKRTKRTKTMRKIYF